VLLPFTNLTLSHFELTYQSVSVDFLDLPKPYTWCCSWGR